MSVAPDRIRKRLARVFMIMFPAKSGEEIPEATMENTDGWDSLATLSLFTLTDEEFGIKLGLDLIGETKSFHKLEALVIEKVG
ncbi:acyl carrier protein [Acetobacter sacchari]|uniref:Acyl carrier protein n=1 Tax=Acetobacter sacchari TaxID=2661687 RepID=A0ABS3LT80_9PROT|nr:acyl carrier protein [Acetobacter sacchari]MBO1359117.1 acyl carrier protein [Acetobacter sacchari]